MSGVQLLETDRASAFVSQKKLLTRAGAWPLPNPVKLSSFSLITVQTVISVSHVVCAHVGGPKNLGTRRLRPLRMARLIL